MATNPKILKGTRQGRKKKLAAAPQIAKQRPESDDPGVRTAMLQAIAAVQKNVIEARTDPVKFVSFVMRDPNGVPFQLEDYHKFWIRQFIEASRVQILAAKGHGKTSILLGVLLYIIGTNRNVRIKFFTQSELKATERCLVLEEMIESSEELHLIFPDLRPDPKGPWHKAAFKVVRDAVGEKEPTFQSAGIMSSVEGGRADLVVFDDICDHRTSLLQPQMRFNLKRKVYAEILQMLDKKGRAISIATPHHNEDAVASLENNTEWKSFRFPVGTDLDPYLPLWPAMWPRAALMAKCREVQPLEYDRAYRLIVRSGGGIQIVKPEHIKFYNAEMIQNPWNLYCVQAYDLAIGQERGASFFAGVTVLYDPEKQYIFVADAFRDRMGFLDQAQLIVDNCIKWQPMRIAIERTGYQAALIEYLTEKGLDLLVYPISPGSKSKELRLTETLPFFTRKQIFFHPKMDPAHGDIARGDLISELLTFSTSRDRDMGDAFAYSIKALQDFIVAESDGNDEFQDGVDIASRLSII